MFRYTIYDRIVSIRLLLRDCSPPCLASRSPGMGWLKSFHLPEMDISGAEAVLMLDDRAIGEDRVCTPLSA